MTQAYDYQLGSMKFLSAASAETPYRRSSGEIRTQQIDTNSQPGEQSLNSWWLRSQPSFHYGEGYAYNEPSSDEEVQGACARSYGVDLLSQPGKASLLRTMSSYGTRTLYSGMSNYWAENLGGEPGYIALNTATSLYVLYKGVIAGWSSGTESQTSFCTDGTYHWFTSQSRVYRGIAADPSQNPTEIYNWSATNDQPYVAFVKGRLILAIGSGADASRVGLYELDGYRASSTTLPARFFESAALTSPAFTRIVEGPNAIYVSGIWGGSSRGFLMKFVLSASGALPTISAPSSAFTFELGEKPNDITVWNGSKMVMATNQGIRVGDIQPNGDILFGPLFLKGSACASVKPYKNFVMVGMSAATLSTADLNDPTIGSGPSPNDNATCNAGLVRIDMSRPKRDGTYPWCHDLDTGATTGSVRGFVVSSSTTDFWCLNDTAQYRTHTANHLVSSGYVRTGWIRFNTQEDKFYKYVTIRNRSAGSIGVSTVAYASDAATATTTTSVGTVTSGSVGHVDLARTAPEEKVALKFTLNRHASTLTTGAEMEGYQVRALPAPTKHRVIRIPVMLFPEMRDHKGQRVPPLNVASTLSTLESLEDDGTIITFQHLDNGVADATRQVSVVIESVDYVEQTPPANARGEGGVAYITLRTVAA